MTTYTCFPFGLVAEIDNTIEIEKCVAAHRISSSSVTKPDEQELNNLCESLCADCGCKYIEKVFPGDFSPQYVEQQIDTDVIGFEIRKSDGQGEVISDQSLGEWIENSYWNADWNLIRNVYGGGQYNIIINYNVLGVESTKKSHTFQLTQFNECIADGCVKFIFKQSGKILDGRVFDPERTYETRLPGLIVDDTPEQDEKVYETNKREIKTIQNKVKRVYRFESKLIQYDQKEMILDNLVFADSFIVTDRNVNTKTFVNKELKLESIDALEDKQGTNYYTISIIFTDLIQNKIKRPCND